MPFLSLIRDVFIVLDVFLAFGFVFAFVKGHRFRPDFDFEGHGHGSAGKKKIFTLRDAITNERWHLIMKKFSLGTPESARIAVIEADALVDTVLKSTGVPGEHLADRLSNLDTDELTTMDKLLRAHRLRNDLVHTSGFVLSTNDAKMALDSYEAFLKELGLLGDDEPPAHEKAAVPVE